ncbi:DMT family transporter [Paenibacillus sp. MZ04-78.2]|uniref:EamA family transporter n=1 Tax=Paenibacillus sp. MZ04-78.2 TaxID=2962034 RepID=UPI0020B815C9|nr:EamA family transporter [Paenibacillus sp. MZ04-78.2]MCP3773213.1 DMT family transporter [Paenibacillus sp. MZ04-78.2]
MNIVLSLLLVIGSGMTHAVWNLFAKQSEDKSAFLWVSNIGFVLGLIPAALASGRLKRAVRGRWKIVLLGSLLSPGSYLLFLLAMRHAQVSYIAPLREIGIVFGTLLGLIVLNERQGARRLAASVIVIAGIVMIAGSG